MRTTLCYHHGVIAAMESAPFAPNVRESQGVAIAANVGLGICVNGAPAAGILEAKTEGLGNGSIGLMTRANRIAPLCSAKSEKSGYHSKN